MVPGYLTVMKRGRPDKRIYAFDSDDHPQCSYECSNTVACQEDEACRFIARIRYQGSSSIITIPANIMRVLDIKYGDHVEIQINKNKRDIRDIK